MANSITGNYKHLSENDVANINKLLSMGVNTKTVAEITGRSYETIRRIKIGKREEYLANDRKYQARKKAHDVTPALKADPELTKDIDKYIYQTFLEHIAQTLEAILVEQKELRDSLNAIVKELT